MRNLTRSTLPTVCPRDRGTMLPTQRDQHGEFRVCLSCGYCIDRTVGPPMNKKPQRVGIRPRRLRKRWQ